MNPLRDIPIDKAKFILDAGKSAESRRSQTIRVAIAIDPAAPTDLVSTIRDAFVPQRATGLIHVCRIVDGQPLQVNPDTDVALIVAGGSDDQCAAAAVAFATAGIRCAIVARSSVEAPSAQVLGGTAVDLVVASSPSLLTDRLARWICDSTDKDLAFAANFPFIRKPKAMELITACSTQNAAVSAIPILKGADLPVMAANEAAMALSIAAIYGRDLSADRIPEIVSVFVGGLGMRGVARLINSVVPQIGWATGIVIGYLGAEGMGYLLIRWFEYLEAGGSVDEVRETALAHVPEPVRQAVADRIEVKA